MCIRDRFQEVLRTTVDVPVDGTDVSISPPTVDVDAPISAPTGSLRIGIDAADDTSIESMTVWWRGEKVAYGSSQDPKLSMDLDIPLEAGSQRLTVVVVDDDGNKIRRRRSIRGVPADEPGAAAAD